jgi:hypothetical protein
MEETFASKFSTRSTMACSLGDTLDVEVPKKKHKACKRSKGWQGGAVF